MSGRWQIVDQCLSVTMMRHRHVTIFILAAPKATIPSNGKPANALKLGRAKHDSFLGNRIHQSQWIIPLMMSIQHWFSLYFLLFTHRHINRHQSTITILNKHMIENALKWSVQYCFLLLALLHPWCCVRVGDSGVTRHGGREGGEARQWSRHSGMASQWQALPVSGSVATTTIQCNPRLSHICYYTLEMLTQSFTTGSNKWRTILAMH